LKKKAWKKLQPIWDNWSKGYKLDIDQLTLRYQKAFKEIEGDVDAIWPYFLKKKANS
jgi:hypothetical protein